MKLFRLLAIVGFAFASVSAQGQVRPKRQYWTVMPFVGAASYVGDLTSPEKKGIPSDQVESFKFMRYTLGVAANYHFHPKMSLRGNLAFVNLFGDDTKSTRNKNRGLNFTSNIFEASAMVQYDFFGSQRGYLWRSKVSPYVFAGIGAAYVMPKVNTQVIPSDPTNIYNRVESASNLAIVVPFGAGVRYKLTDNVDLHLEVPVRWTSSDKVDGIIDYVGGYNDWYYSVQVGANFILNLNPNKCPKPKTKNKKGFPWLF